MSYAGLSDLNDLSTAKKHAVDKPKFTWPVNRQLFQQQKAAIEKVID